MKNDFDALSPGNFETISADLVGSDLKLRFELFADGPDGGIDGRCAQANGLIILQAKRYGKSGYSALKSKMKSERSSIDRIDAQRYILTTSVQLTPANKSELAEIIGPSLQSTTDIYGRDDLDALLRRFPNILKAHPGLWQASAEVMKATFNEVLDERGLGAFIPSTLNDLLRGPETNSDNSAVPVRRTLSGRRKIRPIVLWIPVTLVLLIGLRTIFPSPFEQPQQEESEVAQPESVTSEDLKPESQIQDTLPETATPMTAELGEEANAQTDLDFLEIFGECGTWLGPMQIAGFNQPNDSQLLTTECVDGTFRIKLTHEATDTVSDVLIWQGSGAAIRRYKLLRASRFHHGMELKAERYWYSNNRYFTGEVQQLEFVGSCSGRSNVFLIDITNGNPTPAVCDGSSFRADVRFGGGLYSRIEWWPEDRTGETQTRYWWKQFSEDTAIKLEELPTSPPDFEEIGIARVLDTNLAHRVTDLEWMADPFALGTGASIFIDSETNEVIGYDERRQLVEDMLEEVCDEGSTCWRIATHREFSEMVQSQLETMDENRFLGLQRPSRQFHLRGYVVLGKDPVLEEDAQISNGRNDLPTTEDLVIVYINIDTQTHELLDSNTENVGGTCDYNDCGIWLVRTVARDVGDIME